MASLNILKYQGLMSSQGSYYELLGKSDEMKLLVQKITYERRMSMKFVDEDLDSIENEIKKFACAYESTSSAEKGLVLVVGSIRSCLSFTSNIL